MTGTHFLPTYRHQVVERTTVIDNVLSDRPSLIILRGGAGIGKSTTATQIAQSWVGRTRDGEAVWVRLGRGESGLSMVWQRIFSALLDSDVLSADSRAASLSAGGVTTALDVAVALRELRHPVLLILDNAQEGVTSSVEASLLDVLEATSTLTMLITTRRTLATLVSTRARLRIPIAKLTKDDLYLSRDEVTDLVRRRFPQELSPDALARRIYEKTRGWPVAVHALLIEHQPFSASPLSPIDKKPPSGLFLKDLAQQLLSSTDENGHRVLFVLAHFGEMTPEIAARVSGQRLAQCIAVLAEDLSEYLDYWTDETGANWYALHELVAGELRHQFSTSMDTNEKERLARNAAAALRDERPRLAMQAAIIGRDWGLLSELLVSGTTITLSRNQQAVTLRDIPENVREQHPVIGAFALIHEYAFPTGLIGRAQVASRLLASRRLESLSVRPGFPGLTAATLRMVVARLTGRQRTAITMAQTVSDRLAELSTEEREKYGPVLQTAVNQCAITLLHAGRFTEVTPLLEPMWAWEDRLQPKSQAHMVALAAWAEASEGRLDAARRLVDHCEALSLPVGWQNSYIGAGYRIAAATLALEDENPSEAHAHLSAMREHEPTIEHWPFLAYLEALMAEQQHGPEAALHVLYARSKKQHARTTASDFMRSMLQALRARLSWQSGRVLPPVRRRHAKGLPAIYASLSRGDLDLAAAIATGLSADALTLERPRILAEVLLLRADIAIRLDEQSVAMRYGSRAQTVLNEYGMVLPMRAIPEETANTLSKMVDGLSVAHAAPVRIRDITPLTPAEQRTLNAVVEHGTIPAAADVLYLSRETVKWNIKQVYRKLGVSSRKDAIQVAANAGLLHQSHDDTR